jgi:hypothetical protein
MNTDRSVTPSLRHRRQLPAWWVWALLAVSLAFLAAAVVLWLKSTRSELGAYVCAVRDLDECFHQTDERAIVTRRVGAGLLAVAAVGALGLSAWLGRRMRGTR